jgi:hypothetical protein
MIMSSSLWFGVLLSTMFAIRYPCTNPQDDWGILRLTAFLSLKIIHRKVDTKPSTHVVEITKVKASQRCHAQGLKESLLLWLKKKFPLGACQTQ